MLMLHEKGFFSLKINSPDQVYNCALPEIRLNTANVHGFKLLFCLLVLQ